MDYHEVVLCRPPDVPKNIVPHPRFGKKPGAGGRDIPPKAHGHWFYRQGKVFPNSAIRADTTKQVESCYQLGFYVDCLEVCRDCRRPFIFFAVEQKHWYEDIGFKFDSWCVRCVECRKTDRTLRQRFKRFSAAVAKDDLDDKELAV